MLIATGVVKTKPRCSGSREKPTFSSAQIALPGTRRIEAYCSKLSPEKTLGSGALGALNGWAASSAAAFRTASAVNGTGEANGSAAAGRTSDGPPAAASAPPSASPKNSRRCGLAIVQFVRSTPVAGSVVAWTGVSFPTE